MTDAQYITFILGFAATIAAIVMALLINNARLNDVKEALRAEIRAIDTKAGDMKETLRAEIKASEAALLSQLAIYQIDIITKIAGLDNRIT